ncbi:MAG: nickel/cobalt transporter, partial [Thermoleophilaceae bacterium]
MKRLLLGAIAVALLAVAPAAGAHPLGNFSINHLDQVRVSTGQVRVRYILDQAEIPTFQERGLAPSAVLAKKRAEVMRALELTVNGRRVQLHDEPGASIAFPPGQGGLRLTRVELPLSARVSDPRSVRLRDVTFEGRVGWKAIVIQPGAGMAVSSSVPAADPTGGLRAYPKDTLSSPLDQRSAGFVVKPGHGTVSAPPSPFASAPVTHERSGDGFARVLDDAIAGHGVLVFLLLAAFAWGAVHALSPGHGKAMVAAYLVGARGRPRHAVALGATVTVTHTIGVFALGVVTLLLSQFIVPEQLYPWLNLASGLLVVTIGVAVLRSRLRVRAHEHHHDHDHHHHHAPDEISWKGLIGMGASAGLIPCPSALVVLLGAISQHQVALGLLLILAFSLGLAGTLTGLGLLVVSARRALTRVNFGGGVLRALPA